MKVLVTGATGFVGANLTRYLLKKTNVDVHITARSSSRFWRLEEVQDDLAGIHEVDLADRGAVFAAIEKLRPDVIYHIATFGGLPHQVDHDRIIDANLRSTMNLLDAAVQYGVGQFINTGSSSEYGIKDRPMREDDICQPLSVYGITKLAATQYCTMVGLSTGFKVCTLRLFSPYGPYEESTRLYASLVEAYADDKRPSLSRPQSVRDFIEVEQVNEVYDLMLRAPYQPGDVFNVGSGQQQTIEQFARKIAEEMGKAHLEPIWGAAEPRRHEPKFWEADMSKLRALLEQVER